MKILNITNNINPLYGGTTTTVENTLIASAQNKKNSIELIVPIQSSVLFKKSINKKINQLIKYKVLVNTKPNIPFFNIFSEKYGLSFSLVFWMIKNIKNYNIIHCHGCWSLSTLVAIILGNKYKIPLVLSPHETLTDFDISSSSNLLTFYLKKKLKGFIVNNVDIFVFSSKLELDESKKIPKEKKIFIYHPIISLNKKFKFVKKINSKKIIVGFLGRMHQKKNIALLIKSMIYLPDNYFLFIAGDGNSTYKNYLQKLITTLNLQDRIILKGWLDNKSRDLFFNDIDLLCMPSVYECFGNTAAEAIARGKPVIVSNKTGISEVIKTFNAGLVIKPTVKNIYKSIIFIIDNLENTNKMLKNTLLAYNSSLSASAYCNSISKIYLSLKK